MPLKNSTKTASSHCLYPPNFLFYVSISVLMLRDCNLNSPIYFCSVLCGTKFCAVQVELLPYVSGYVSEVILRLAYSRKANLKLCVPCIILQCVNDQRDAKFL